MKSPALLSPAKAAVIVLVCAGASATAVPPILPDDRALKREADKQMKGSAAAIDKAYKQSMLLRRPVPDVSPVSPLAAPDPAAIAKRYDAVDRREESSLFVMVSFSMPSESIERLAEQAEKAGATLVLRGVIENSLTKTAEMVASYVKKYPSVQFQVDPNLYRRFDVKQVPTFVIAKAAEDAKSCGRDCDARNTFASVAGDVTLEYALDYFARHGDVDVAPLAESRLKKVRGAL